MTQYRWTNSTRNIGVRMTQDRWTNSTSNVLGKRREQLLKPALSTIQGSKLSAYSGDLREPVYTYRLTSVSTFPALIM